LYGYSVEEIAAKLGVGLEAAQSLLARAKRGFQEVYSTLTTDLVNGVTKGDRSVADPS
jgi:DNA-directed RNA polymerase specialized sigma24 family protein